MLGPFHPGRIRVPRGLPEQRHKIKRSSGATRGAAVAELHLTDAKPLQWRTQPSINTGFSYPRAGSGEGRKYYPHLSYLLASQEPSLHLNTAEWRSPKARRQCNKFGNSPCSRLSRESKGSIGNQDSF